MGGDTRWVGAGCRSVLKSGNDPCGPGHLGAALRVPARRNEQPAGMLAGLELRMEPGLELPHKGHGAAVAPRSLVPVPRPTNSPEGILG